LLNPEPLLQRLLSRRRGLARRRGGGADEPHRPNPADESPLTSAIYAELDEEKARAAGRDPVLRGLRPGRVAVVVGASILGGARYPDEPVRHVALDLIGDLTLAGAPIMGHVTAHGPTHETTYVFARALMSTPDAWTWA
jgi:UDP-3-O-[3-hydroxymyristoyl] N-acetylglucosamine deacetylase